MSNNKPINPHVHFNDKERNNAPRKKITESLSLSKHYHDARNKSSTIDQAIMINNIAIVACAITRKIIIYHNALFRNAISMSCALLDTH